MSQPVEIFVCPPEQRRAALSLVFESFAPAQQARQVESILAEADAGQTSLDGLFIARRGGRVAGAVWSQLQPGRTASLWPPQVISAWVSAAVEPLVAAATEYAARSGARLAQSLVEMELDDGRVAKCLLQHGYNHLTDLIYLLCLDADFPSSPPAGALDFERCSSDSFDRLAALLDATYTETQDCPALNGVRRPGDILAGYAAVGDPAAVQWLLATQGGQDVGCVLLAGYGQDGTAELVYMGLAPAARGKGLGIGLIRHAQWLAYEAGYERMVAAVDVENRRALKVYAAAGFVGWDRRSVFVRVFPDS